MANLLGITPLLYGAHYGNLDVCKILLEHGANPDLRDVYGRTALMKAAALGHINVAKMLIKAGANIAIKDRCSDSLRHCTKLSPRKDCKINTYS